MLWGFTAADVTLCEKNLVISPYFNLWVLCVNYSFYQKIWLLLYILLFLGLILLRFGGLMIILISWLSLYHTRSLLLCVTVGDKSAVIEKADVLNNVFFTDAQFLRYWILAYWQAHNAVTVLVTRWKLLLCFLVILRYRIHFTLWFNAIPLRKILLFIH